MVPGMSTPAMAFGAGLRNVLVSLWLIWSATFVISRIFLLHDAYISEANKRVDERWLLERCREPEFYSNLRQHTDLCTEVAKNARASLFLTALNSVASQTHACGTASCLDLVFTMFSRLGWHVALLLLVLMVVAPNFLYMLLLQLQSSRRQQRKKQLQPLSASYAVLDDGDIHEGHALMALRSRWSSQQQLDEKLKRRACSNNTVKLV